MKKFIKKTISGLIAGVMAVSSMPFTALAGDSYNAKPATSFNAKTGTATVYWDQSSDKNCTGHYNNLLYFNSYSEGIKGTPTADTGGNNCYTRAWYPTMVFLYDGVNDSYAPVMGTADKSDWATSRYLNYFVPMDNNDSNNLKDSSNFYCDNWIGSNGGTLDYTWTLDPSNRHHGVRASITDTTSSIFGLSSGTFYPHSSKLHVRNTVSFEGNEGYSHAQKIWWFAGSHTSNGKAPASGDKNFGEARKTTYVVNYKPLYDKAKEVAEHLKTFDETKYTVASVNAYYTAINAMYNFDPNSYFTNISEADVEKKVNDCAQAIKKCVDDYIEADGALEELPQIEQSYIDSYNNALEEAEAKALYPDRYTADSINDLNAEIASVKTARDSVKTNEDLEALTTRLLTAISNLVQAKFNVVFVTVGLDSTTENEEFNKYIEYGETCNADAGANVKKWVVTTDNGNTSTVIDNFDQKASFVITKDAKIYAYLSGEDSSKSSSKVTFLGRHNQVVAIRYVAEGKTLDTTKVDAPSIPFYHFENWDVASVKGDGNEYTVKATYTCNQASSDFCTVHFGEWSKAYAYDSYVYLPNTVAGKKYALYSDKQCTKLLTVLDGVDFYAPKTSHIYVKAYEAEEKASIAVTGSFAEKDVEKGKKYANFNCKFYLPAGEAIEWGVEVLSPDGTKTAKVKAEKLSERNEYTVRFGTAIGSSVTSIKGRAYLVYVQGGVKKTIYSPEFVTVNLNA